MQTSIKSTPHQLLLSVFAAVVLLLFAGNLHADDILEAIDEGVSAYKKGELSEAVSQLDYASGLIRQKKAEAIKAVFPDALNGWQAGVTKSESAGGILGGGISANRQYKKDDAKVDIQLLVDSPMLQSMMGMFNNPSMITMSGGKLIKVQGHKTIHNGNPDRPELTLIIDSNAMFTLKGNSATSFEQLKAYGEALKLDKL